MTFALKPRQTVLFIGDSITDCGRRGSNAPLGFGYVQIIADLIMARYPAHQLTFINKGIGGETVRELSARWSDDVIRLQPDWVSVKVGINDLHRYLFHGDGAKIAPGEEYAQRYEHMLQRVRKETKARLVLVDPFYISTDSDQHSNRSMVLKTLPRYLKVVHELAEKYDARLVKTHDAFQKLLKHEQPERLCPEPVHPNPSGHLVIAHEWLKVMDW